MPLDIMQLNLTIHFKHIGLEIDKKYDKRFILHKIYIQMDKGDRHLPKL